MKCYNIFVKKFGAYVLLFTVIANIFAPISLQKSNSGDNRKSIKVLTASAERLTASQVIDECVKKEKDICIASYYIASSGETTSSAEFRINLYTKESWLASEDVSIDLKVTDSADKVLLKKTIRDSQMEKVDSSLSPYADRFGYTHYTAKISDLKDKLSPSTEYKYSYEGIKIVDATTGGVVVGATALVGGLVLAFFVPPAGVALAVKGGVLLGGGAVVMGAANSSNEGMNLAPVTFTTPKKADPGAGRNVNLGGDAYTSNGDSVMPACGLGINSTLFKSEGTIPGCFAQFFYYVLFVPTSFLFALSGKFFDFAFGYSIQDTSYRTGFVLEGWKIVRDLCNMFFIFVILYAAFKMILGIGTGGKDDLIKVIIVGLLINFSLFATQIVIDSSNILARLFYNSNAISVIASGNNPNVSRAGVNLTTQTSKNFTELSLSAALVAKVNPQEIIIQAKRINIQPDTSGITNPDGNPASNGIGVGAFILLVILTTAINVTGIFVFMSIALIFIGRVVGLWFAMIFVPFAFFSYTMPGLLDSVKMVGWKNWVPETMKLAFVAPVFMFFMYLILLFLDTGFVDLMDPDSTGAEFVLRTIVPFIFIMIMLIKAKDIAKDMSGTIAQGTATGLAAAGALAVGGAALGTAVVGRGAASLAARASTGSTATQRYETAKQALTTAGGRDPSLMQNMSRWDRFKGSAGSKLGLGAIYGKQTVTPTVDPVTGMRVRNSATVGDVSAKSVGGILNNITSRTSDKDSSLKKIEKAKESAGIDKDTNNNSLSHNQLKDIKDEYSKAHEGKVEKDIREGKVAGVVSEKTYISDIANRTTEETKIRDDRRIDAEARIMQRSGRAPGPLTTTEIAERDNIANNMPLTSRDQTTIDNRLKKKYEDEVLKPKTAEQVGQKFDADLKTSKEKVTITERLVTQSQTGTFNPLDISKMVSAKNDSMMSKMLIGISASVALGMRNGLKNGIPANLPNGDRDFTKGLLNVLKAAMETAKQGIK
jgi:hypothetical protein